MSVDPAAGAIGLLSGGEGPPSFLGSCFAFRQRHVFLTAAHCVGRLEASQVYVANMMGDRLGAVSIVRHPKADLAIIRIAEKSASAFQPLSAIATTVTLGGDVGAVGFPEDSSSDGLRPTGRVFRGYLQRRFFNESHLGYQYDAVEVNFAAPAGLSGGPLFAMPHSLHLIGIVAENWESSTYLRSVEEVEDAGHTYKETVSSVVNYGIAVSAAPLENWISEACR